jgi:kynurenine formamidase
MDGTPEPDQPEQLQCWIVEKGDWRAAAEEVRNWGRWGADDEVGTLNLIDSSAIIRAARLVRRGVVFPLGNAFDGDGPHGGHGFRRNPIHLMSFDGGDSTVGGERLGTTSTDKMVEAMWQNPMRFNDDYIMMPLQASTQWDAIAHVYYDDQLYNGYPADSVTSFGASKNGIDKMASAGGFVGRGVLIDVARFRGVEHLEPRSLIYPDELDEILDSEHIELAQGDILMVRTGWWLDFERRRDGDAWTYESPGLSWTCAKWLHEYDVAAVASDNIAVETLGEVEGVNLPLHMLALRDMGLTLGEMWNFESLSEDCRQDGIYECMLVAQPIKFTGAVGSPLNPIAIK